jgi:two-component system, NarL family, nitrate/nitrite response regulator NarL
LQLHSPPQRKGSAAKRTGSLGSRNGNHWIPRKRTGDGSRRVPASHEPRPVVARALIVDRDFMSGDLLASALGRDPSLDVKAVQSCDLMQTLAKTGADLVVIASELNDKSRNGFDLAWEIDREHPGVFIVILLDHSSRDAVVNAFRSGALGVFCREQPMAEFFECIQQVRKGLIWVRRQDAQALLEIFRSIPALSLTNSGDSPALTVRELQVVQCAAKGKTNRAIACELGLSEHTVKNYLFRAFEKLGVSSRVELLFYLTQRGHKFDVAKPEVTNTELVME